LFSWFALSECFLVGIVYTLCLKKNEPTLASCSFDKHGLILIILGKQHQHTFKNYTPIQLSLSLHFYLLYLLLNSCGGNDAKHNAAHVFLSRLFVALKRASFSLADVHSDILSRSRFTHARNCLFHWSTASSMTFLMRRCLKSLVSRHFHCSYLKANKVSKSEGTRNIEYE